MISMNIGEDLDIILAGHLGNIEISDNDKAKAKRLLDEISKARVETFYLPPARPANVMELIVIGDTRAHSQKIRNLWWEPEKSVWDFFKNLAPAALSGSGVPAVTQILAGTASITLPTVVLPAVAIASVAIGLRWSAKVSVPLRAAYILHYAWQIGEYAPNGHEFAVLDLLSGKREIMARYGISKLDDQNITDDLNELISLNCIEPIALNSGVANPGVRQRRCRLLEKVRIRKSGKEYF